MGLFKRRASRFTALAEPPPSDTEGLLAEIRRLTGANRSRRDRDVERRLLAMRHLAGLRLIESDAAAEYPAPDFDRLPGGGDLPEIAIGELTPGLLRAGILRDGCVLVRGLVDREAALGLAAQIDRVFEARAAFEAGSRPTPGYYEEFEPEARFKVASVRPWIRDGGGVLAGDSPMVSYEMLELFESAGLIRLVADYLGEPPLLSVHKTTLRKAEPVPGGAWHQDGAFMGDVRALNLWLSLSHCGDVAPGLDILPRRVEEVVIDHDVMLDVELTRRKAEEAAGETLILRPIFEPGDALFFDELFLHQTASDPSTMTKHRFAIESWFFGGSAFPADYAPLAV
jgi:hypothetical protein